MPKGRCIVVEGLEGAGKSTAIATIQDYLVPLVPHVILTREPGGTRIGEAIRVIIKETSMENLHPYCELLLFYAARVQLIEQVIKPALERGDWVVTDRFELSTIAYQGGGRGINLDAIQQLSTLCLGNFKPDLTFFLDIPPALGLKRVRLREKAMDRIEQESLVFFEKVRHTYHKAIKGMDNVVVIDATQPLETVQNAIITQLQSYYVA